MEQQLSSLPAPDDSLVREVLLGMDPLYQIIVYSMTFCIFAIVFLLITMGILYIVGNKNGAIRRTAKIALILVALTVILFIAGIFRAHAVVA